jgi:predicted nucleotidyltransferase
MPVQISPRKPDHKTMLHLPRRVKAALDDFQRRLLELFPGEISQLILYGSYARGEATPDSDVDVMVVVKWREKQLPDGTYLAWFGDPGWNQIIDVASDVLLERDVYISPLVMSEARATAGKEFILHAIQREGKILWKTRPI